MGLFSFFKKGAKSNKNSSEKINVFKGDLAKIQEIKEPIIPLIDSEKVSSIQPKDSKFTNSKDAVVFMSFSGSVNLFWHCPQCGTANDSTYDGCVVCGYNVNKDR